MSVKKEPSGRRSIEVEVEVPGTPEQVWQAIATGPGISSWFVPAKVEGRVGGAVSLDFGGGMVSSATVTEWKPPHRFAAEDKPWSEGAPPIATEWTVEAKSGGSCIVRVVHSLFASTDDWDDQLEGVESGWPAYFRVLRHYLAHHAGEPSASFVLTAPGAPDANAMWNKLARALGTPEPRVGQNVRVQTRGGATLAGTLHAYDESHGKGVMLVANEPAPGVVLVSAMDCMGMRMATLQAFFYGPRAGEAAAQQEHWEHWLHELFPPEEAGTFA